MKAVKRAILEKIPEIGSVIELNWTAHLLDWANTDTLRFHLESGMTFGQW